MINILCNALFTLMLLSPLQSATKESRMVPLDGEKTSTSRYGPISDSLRQEFHLINEPTITIRGDTNEAGGVALRIWLTLVPPRTVECEEAKKIAARYYALRQDRNTRLCHVPSYRVDSVFVVSVRSFQTGQPGCGFAVRDLQATPTR